MLPLQLFKRISMFSSLLLFFILSLLYKQTLCIDPEVADAIGDLFSTLTEVPELCSTITERVVPTFVRILRSFFNANLLYKIIIICCPVFMLIACYLQFQDMNNNGNVNKINKNE